MPRPGRVLTAPQGTRSIKENENAPPEGGEFQTTREFSRTYLALIKMLYNCVKAARCFWRLLRERKNNLAHLHSIEIRVGPPCILKTF